MIIECVSIIASPASQEDLRRGLASLVEPTQVRSGCINCQLYQNLSDPNELRFESQWRTTDEFIPYACSDLYRTLLELLEMSVRTPTVKFYEISASHGLELVRMVRERHGVSGSARQSYRL
jgi:quinol monooxygenase YgiN